jgi:hypothetical protein
LEPSVERDRAKVPANVGQPDDSDANNTATLIGGIAVVSFNMLCPKCKP